MKIIYYYHIPKCGGSHISRHMMKLSNAVGGEFYNFDASMGNFSFNEEESNNEELKRFYPSINQGDVGVKFIHHHHGYYGIGEMYEFLSEEKEKAEKMGNSFYLFTCIREPMSFLLSRVNFLRNSCGMPHLSFDDTINSSKHHNIMYRYLLQNHYKRWRDNDLDEIYFKKVLGIMDDVFLLEEMDALLEHVNGIAGFHIPSPTKKVNQGEYLVAPTEAQISELKRVNHLDVFFYDLIKERRS